MFEPTGQASLTISLRSIPPAKVIQHYRNYRDHLVDVLLSDQEGTATDNRLRSRTADPMLGSMTAKSEYDLLSERIYQGLRGGWPVRDAAVELACLLLDWQPDPVVRELVERSPGELTDDRVAELAGLLIADFEPGFDLVPERWETLVQALRTVERDLRATGPKRTADVDLIRPDWSREWDTAYVSYDGNTHGSGIGSGAGTDPDQALEAVADALQEAVIESTWTVWPLCPVDHTGLHPSQDARQRAVWHCRPCGGPIATIGEL